jgi:hypothetical protein
MQVSSSVSFLWYVTISLDIILAALVVRRRVIYKFPFFTLFILISTARSLLLWMVYRQTGYASLFAFYVAWSTQALLLIGRGAVCAELCWRVLSPFSGLWSVARRVLVGIGVILAIYTAIDSLRAVASTSNFLLGVEQEILAAERGLELSIATVLVSLLLVALRYRTSIPRTPLLLVTGLCFYSLVQTLNTASTHWQMPYISTWNGFRMIPFQVALALWILAFARKDSGFSQHPIEMVPEVYDMNVEKVSQDLRSLNEDLEELIRR